MPIVRSIQEAMEWFIANSGGKVLCVNEAGESFEADCFPAAKAFFGNK